MQPAVNPASLIYALEVSGVRLIIACRELLERFLVRHVPIYFVGAYQDKYGSGTVLAGCLQQVDGTERVDLEIRKRNPLGFVVRRLRCTVDDQVKRVLLEKGHDACAVPDVERVVPEVPRGALESLQVPGGVTSGAEKLTPHVVVDAEDAMSQAIELPDCFGSN